MTNKTKLSVRVKNTCEDHVDDAFDQWVDVQESRKNPTNLNRVRLAFKAGAEWAGSRIKKLETQTSYHEGLLTAKGRTIETLLDKLEAQIASKEDAQGTQQIYDCGAKPKEICKHGDERFYCATCDTEQAVVATFNRKDPGSN